MTPAEQFEQAYQALGAQVCKLFARALEFGELTDIDFQVMQRLEARRSELVRRFINENLRVPKVSA